eukprot:2768089-Rhodomonas_salina.1
MGHVVICNNSEHEAPRVLRANARTTGDCRVHSCTCFEGLSSARARGMLNSNKAGERGRGRSDDGVGGGEGLKGGGGGGRGRRAGAQ